MIEQWDMTKVSGVQGEDAQSAAETVLHRRGEDPMVIAFRRNRALTGCNRIVMETVACFNQERKGPEARRTKDEIPSGGHQGEEWDW